MSLNTAVGGNISPIAEEVPEKSFLHVEQSLDNGIKEGMLLEILHKRDPDVYWIASITMVCGHLLRIRFIGSDTDFWCDLLKTDVHAVGWCDLYDEMIELPQEISDMNRENIVSLMKNAVKHCTSIPDSSILENGLTPIDRLKPGMKIEVQNNKNPFEYWIATILQNIGGRLLVRYDAPENIYEDFWIFYTSPRLHAFGLTEKKGIPWRLKYPECVNGKVFDIFEWTSCFKAACEAAKLSKFPEDLMKFDPKPSHNVSVGMKLEAVNPLTMDEICPATVVEIFDDVMFLVVIDDFLNEPDYNRGYWLCDMSHPYVFPIGWAKSKGLELTAPAVFSRQNIFEWDQYLEITSADSVPIECFQHPGDAFNMGFKNGMKLEAIDPSNPDIICSGRIVKIINHLLSIEIDSSDKLHWFSWNSLDIFPPGWCTSNRHPLESLHESVDVDADADAHSIDEIKSPGKNEKFSTQKEEWCNRIFFNYKCYSGPFISRNKLSQLPKYVGAGPLPLVIREVLNMIISSAYKPAKLLKDWEWEGKTQPDTKLEMLKAKLKTSTYHANVQVISKNEDVPIFCRDICSKLQACPYLFGQLETNDHCPEKCLLVDKSKFQNITADRRGRPKGSMSKSAVPKCWNGGKKRKKRGLHFMTIRAREKRAALELNGAAKEGGESGNESDPSRSSTPQRSEGGTRPNSPDSNSDTAHKKPRKKREPRTNFPPLEMKTRGAKLPNFALQMKEGHWDKKDVETIYSNTCVIPKKQYLDDSESDDSFSCNSLDMRNEEISDVSDSEEPELKKLRVTPLYDTMPTDHKMFDVRITGHFGDEKEALLSLNPHDWSVSDVYRYLIKYDDCKDVAQKLKDEEIDGTAFTMLNLPTMRQHLKMKYRPALALCKHVAILKWSYYIQNNNVM